MGQNKAYIPGGYENMGVGYQGKEVDNECPDGLAIYLREIETYNLLTTEEEKTLFIRLKEGKKAKKKLEKKAELPREQQQELQLKVKQGEYAREKLICSNLRWVVTIARRYHQNGAQLLDIIQDGNIGLLNAIDRFDVTRGYRFTTYSFWYIRLAIQHGSGIQTNSIVYPFQIVERRSKIDSASDILTKCLGRRPTVSELAIQLNLTPNMVNTIRAQTTPCLSLDMACAGCQEHLTTFEDILVDDRDFFKEFFQEEARQDITDLFYVLDDREREVVERCFGLIDGDKWTLEQIGQNMEPKLTRARIHQIKTAALAKLKVADCRGVLKDWLY